MGCDYCIEKVLEVTFVNKAGQVDFNVIELSKQNKYFQINSSDDSDNDDDKRNFRRNYYHYLDINYEPRILFDNRLWKSEQIKNRYSDKLRDYEHLIKVVKKEVRYLRQ